MHGKGCHNYTTKGIMYQIHKGRRLTVVIATVLREQWSNTPREKAKGCCHSNSTKGILSVSVPGFNCHNYSTNIIHRRPWRLGAVGIDGSHNYINVWSAWWHTVPMAMWWCEVHGSARTVNAPKERRLRNVSLTSCVMPRKPRWQVRLALLVTCR